MNTLPPEEQLWKFILDNEDTLFANPHYLVTYRNKITGVRTLAFLKQYACSLREC